MKDIGVFSQIHAIIHNIKEEEEVYLHICCWENTSSSMMLSFKPVGIYLPVDVNNVAFLQCELPEGRKKDSKEHLSF